MTAFEDQAIYPSAELFLIKQFMKREGFHPRQWLLGTGLKEEHILNPETLVSLRQFDIIYHNIFRITNRPDVALALGSSLNLSRWGVLSVAMICSQTLGSALETGNRFRSIVRSRFKLTPHFRKDVTEIVIERQEGMSFPLSTSFSHELLIASMQTMIRSLVKERNVFAEIQLNYAPPAHYQDYEKFFDCPYSFNRERSMLVIPNELMHRPLPTGNPITEQQAIAVCKLEAERVAQVQKGDLTWMLRSEISKQEGPLPSLDDIADRLHVTPRTLRRKLQEAGTSYRRICHEHQLQLALHYLADPKLKSSAVAHKCGFKDAASFREAFKRWTDMTPQEHRKRSRATHVTLPIGSLLPRSAAA
ncbi:MAG: AraC family transcriptional regulator [Pseudomonadota bacterium]|nr:AraC family transcriptional regulator [Pseudomonadota bacterium]